MLWLLGKMRINNFQKDLNFPLNSDIYFTHNSVCMYCLQSFVCYIFIKGENKNSVSTED